jgi:hypothetical protein
MVDTFTLHTLVRHTYFECDPEEKQILEEMAASDPELRAEMRLLRNARRALPKVSFYPKDSTLNKVLDYSRSR